MKEDTVPRMLHVILRTPHSLHLEDNSERQPQLEPMQLSTTVTGPSSEAKPCGVEEKKKKGVWEDFQSQVSPLHLTAVRACTAQ